MNSHSVASRTSLAGLAAAAETVIFQVGAMWTKALAATAFY